MSKTIGDLSIFSHTLDRTAVMVFALGAGVPLAALAYVVQGYVLPALPEGRLPLWDVERELIRRALAKFDGNKSKAAAYLAVPRHVLLYRIGKYKLEGD